MARGTSAETRERISEAAATLFREHGFARTSVRDIASSANADPALVIRHFGSKELLFLEVVHPTLDDEPLLDVPLDRLGSRFIEVLLKDELGFRGVFLALVRGSDESSIAERLRLVHERTFVQPLLTRLSGPDAEQRARFAAALVGGLLYSLWVVGDESLLATDHSQLVNHYGALLQAVLTPNG